MKISDVRAMSVEELKKKEAELREDKFRLKFKLATGEVEDTSKIKATRRDIAKIKTILAERSREENNGK